MIRKREAEGEWIQRRKKRWRKKSGRIRMRRRRRRRKGFRWRSGSNRTSTIEPVSCLTAVSRIFNIVRVCTSSVCLD